MKLLFWRHSNNLSQTALAELLDITQSAVGKYERNERLPSQDVMQKIIEVTNGEVLPNDFYNIAPTQESNHITP